MQTSLFSEPEDDSALGTKPARAAKVRAADSDPGLRALATKLSPHLHLGTSSWNYPGWTGQVWAEDYPEAVLSKHGLAAYAQHPLFGAVSLDRVFYRPLTAGEYAAYAVQVPENFRFVVKAPSIVADAMLRAEAGRGMRLNPAFLDPERAEREFVQPALEGLGHKLGALVFQLSPLSPALFVRMPILISQLDRMLAALSSRGSAASEAVIAVEVRNREWLTPDFVDVLKTHRATYCLGLHAKMPSIAEQLPILRALWPGPLVCRWNLNIRHGAFGYEEAKRIYEPFDRMVDPDLDTRVALARVIAGTTTAGQQAYVTISNKAEGSAPLSVVALAQAVAALSGDQA